MGASKINTENFEKDLDYAHANPPNIKDCVKQSIIIIIVLAVIITGIVLIVKL